MTGTRVSISVELAIVPRARKFLLKAASLNSRNRAGSCRVFTWFHSPVFRTTFLEHILKVGRHSKVKLELGQRLILLNRVNPEDRATTHEGSRHS